ncbi:FAD-dependent oxidoreductase [Paenibacillus sp. CF384]|uniref:FAD-dependent oxidoreductase n=1 Tax=Paenibacillus sp. CF384 TaxID=1884382 RepID=UPI00089790A1|nr:FAD-dependent oxidoreductase [Paenibacillus sp. CF384]SDW10613.1 Pyruvate/2-oxoglutarate dehydrogenase complex, dihydrolipoamide dehydrogenase (E3) component [Paenibacillus sp. CF384]
MEHYEVIIIGFGKGGKTLAAALADRGQKVAVIEQSKMMYGGTCINIGCIPTKSLVHHSNLSRLKKLSSFEEKAAEYHSAIDKKTNLIAALRQKNFENLDKKEAVTLYSGKASFTSQHEISVQTESGAISLHGERIYINTGASIIIPDIDGIQESQRVYTSTTLMEETALPKRLVIIGAGYIGLEFASMYAGFGSEVIVLDSHRDLLEREDRDIAQAIRNTLEKRGVDFRYGAIIQSVIDTEHETAVTYMEDDQVRQVSVDAVLVAAGRKPNIDGLQLSSAGIAITDRGAIQVDENLQTTVPHIFAMGDVTGGLQFTYISLDDQRIIMDHLYGHKSRTTRDRKFVPYSVFIDPPLSRVGLTEQEAIAQGYEVKIAVLQAAAIPRAKLSEETEGLLKAVVDAQTDLILGCSLFCADSHEMINIVQIAMQTEQSYTFLRDHIFTHPSMSESLNDLFQLISHGSSRQ